MKILFASAEVSPFAKVGGLADVVGSLPKSLKKMGHDVRIIMPLYGCIDVEKFGIKDVGCEHVVVQMGNWDFHLGIKHCKLPGSDVDVYFLTNDGYFGNFEYVYPQWVENRFEHERYAVFSKAVLEAILKLDFCPDIIHCNDWHTAFIPLFLKEHFKWCYFHQNIKTVFTIHNFAYQGRFSKDLLSFTGLPQDWAERYDRLECWGEVNIMKGALMFADKITTVSKTYADEIQRSEYGEGLDEILRWNNYKLSGIVNGIDYSVFNPVTDKHIEKNYSVKNLAGKADCKQALQKDFGLEVDPDIPLFGIVSRFVDQKGLDLIAAVAHDFKQINAQLVVLGSGDYWYEDMFRNLSWNSRNIRASIGYNSALAERIYSGSDIFLMPSRFEPCGLSQLIAMAFGTVPLVRQTGGLVDTVRNYNNETQEGTGFTFWNYDATGLLHTIKWAIDVYHDQKAWTKLVKSVMKEDFSWDRSAKEYVNVYSDLVR